MLSAAWALARGRLTMLAPHGASRIVAAWLPCRKANDALMYGRASAAPGVTAASLGMLPASLRPMVRGSLCVTSHQQHPWARTRYPAIFASLCPLWRMA